VRFQGELAHLDRLLQGRDSFVIKPAHGSGGDGVLVISERRNELFVKTDGRTLPLADIEYFVSTILSGVHSLGGIPDAAMIEYCVHPSPLFAAISYRGVPDIRLLIYRGIPAMAMVRLPTRASDGKANLHQGAVGVGISLAYGITGHGVLKDNVISEHPDYGSRLTGYRIPDWEELLTIGARCADLTGLGYCGVDLVLDEDKGPMMLEINARPGLAIQIANRCGLEQRLGQIDALGTLPEAVDDRVRLARTLDADQEPPAIRDSAGPAPEPPPAVEEVPAAASAAAD
jgi:alpha-L-glutamate ligase-like protein